MLLRLFVISFLISFVLSNSFAAEMPGEGSKPAESVSIKATPSPVNSVNLNQASFKELMKVKGMNPKRAKAIIVYRKKHGLFHSVEDLNKVSAFKKMKPEQRNAIISQLSAATNAG